MSPASEETVAAEFEQTALRLAELFGEAGSLGAEAVVELAARAVPHSDHAGLTLIRGAKAPVTLAASGRVPFEVDELQYQLGEGPCLEAIERDDLAETGDLAHDTQWPQFARAAVQRTPVRSMLGVRLALGGDDRGALNFYADQPAAFTPVDRAIGAICSTMASLVLQREVAEQRVQNLEYALDAGRQIGMAMGVLMARRLLTQDQALEELRAASNALHRRLRDVASEVVETGEVPQRPPRRSH